jgi:hypothetical protein
MSLSLAVQISVSMTAARSPPQSESANSQDFRPRAISVILAHVGQDVVVRYRWHPLYGQRVRRIQSERRASGELVHVELTPGAVTILPAWKLDAVYCGGLKVGAPQVLKLRKAKRQAPKARFIPV